MIKEEEINRDEVINELKKLFKEYEKALIENDVPALQQFFWPSPFALRFGATEELHGNQEIDSFRKNRVINFSNRTTVRSDIVAIGQSLGVATLEFTVMVRNEKRHGRQTQVWVHFADLGWRIISAHVSHRIKDKIDDTDQMTAYMNEASSLLQIPLAQEYTDEVIQNLIVMCNVAAPLMDISFPESTEQAAEFTP